jgi:O-succinylbenzoate synthase
MTNDKQQITNYHFKFRPYQRHFRQPLITSHGEWKVREGIILSLTDETGKVGWGEIAPIPWFGSETLEEALNFCKELPSEITDTDIFSIPAKLPACQFGFESAWWGMENGEWGVGSGEWNSCPPLTSLSYSYLLPTGETALHSWQTAWDEGYRTFKWKIGVATLAEELKIFNQLIEMLPKSVKLRLDANGGLTTQEADSWLKICDLAEIVEFIEQPLPPEKFQSMLTMRTKYDTEIALDESVATMDQLEDCYQKGWRGIFVIKAGIAGSPKRLLQFCQDYNIDTVFSSVFETSIARQMALRLAGKLSHRAVGFGVNHWFADDDSMDFR